MRSLLLALLLLVCACGQIPSISAISIKPIGKVRLDSVSTDANIATVVDAGNGAIITVSDRASSAPQIRSFDSDLKERWAKSVAIGEGAVDLAGVHVHDGIVNAPIVVQHEENIREYRLYTFNASNGDSLSSNTLLRLNQHDVGALSGSFSSGGVSSDGSSARAVWSPDSSKILLFKQYPSSTGRIAIEMMLYRRGFALITKNTVDFRFDASAQQLVGILPDNDGVAYICLFNRADSSIEVGRFEILGSKKLRTISHKLPAASFTIGTIGIAPRGHAYVATLANEEGKSVERLIDFDFYQSTARSIEVAGFSPPVGSGEFPISLHVAANEGRMVVSHIESSPAGQKANSVHAFDLDLQPVWNTLKQLPVSPIAQQIYGNAFGSISIHEDTLLWHRQRLEDGKELGPTALATIEGTNSLMSTAIIGKQIYFFNRKLYRLTLP